VARNNQIQSLYEKLSTARERFLDYAVDVAELTIPTLSPRGDRIEMRPFTQLGTQAVQSLSASVNRITFPPQAKWLRFDVPEQQKEGVPEQLIPQLQAMLGMLENQIIEKLTELQYRSKIGRAIIRNIHEGNTAVRVDKDQIRIYPLRNFVVARDAGDITDLVVREEMRREEGEEPRSNVAPGRTSSDIDWLYTHIDYVSGVVKQQSRDDDEPQEVEMSTRQWFVFTSYVPDVDDYATGYAYDHSGIIFEINHLTKSLGEAAAAASWNVPLIREGSSMTPERLRKARSGEPLVCDPEDITWLTSTVKISDWSFVANYRAQLREEMGQIFAMGIKDRLTRAATATEILQIAGELETHTQDLLTGFEQTLQRPLVEATMISMGIDENVVVGDEQLTLFITSGQSALARETGFSRGIQFAQVVKGMDETMVVDGPGLMEDAASALQFESLGHRFAKAQPEPQPGGPGGGLEAPDGSTVQTAGGPQRVGGAPQPAA
jgi:hypothetical protein